MPPTIVLMVGFMLMFVAPAPTVHASHIDCTTGMQASSSSTGDPENECLLPPVPPVPPVPIPPIGPPPEDPDGQAHYTILDTEEYAYGHWKVHFQWRKVNNDGDAGNRYYETLISWLGQGTHSHSYMHEHTQVWHSAGGLNEDGNVFLNDFNPLHHSTGSGTNSFTIGFTGPEVSYSWQNEKPALHRYDWWDQFTGVWEYQTYTNKATFWLAAGGDEPYRGWLEYGATGVIPTGHHGAAFMKAFHQSCDVNPQGAGAEVDDTLWQQRSIDWG